MKQWMTLSEVAEHVGVAAKTIIRWEKSGKIRKSKRDWRGWRIYSTDDVATLYERVNRIYD